MKYTMNLIENVMRKTIMQLLVFEVLEKIKI